ncbi:hypothetical protein GCM10018787_25190 [Streptomyces thermodiastaticus]|nr:hypothetical protein GCM10018787_25190 [Streptomyces thermodiastaticus]
MGELPVLRGVAEHAAEKTDQRIHHLTAQHRKRIDENNASAEPRRFDGRGKSGYSRADHADICFEFMGGRGRGLGDGSDFEVCQCMGHAGQCKEGGCLPEGVGG